MNIKVKIYSMAPAFVKKAMTMAYIRLRKIREKRAADRQELPPQGEPPRVIYLTGFPRSGTTMLKYYFASHEGLRQTPFDPVGFFGAWEQAKTSDDGTILVDKSNHYIYALEDLFRAYGDAVRVGVIVRDPRDCLVSFTRYQENREVPRNAHYWRYWRKMHDDLLRFATENEFGHCVWIVRYEDLVREPEKAKAAFLNWIGFEVDSADLDRRYKVAHPGEGWHDSVLEHREIGTHALQKWQQMKEIPPWAMELLPAWNDDPDVSELMGRLGYTAGGFDDKVDVPEGCNFFRLNVAE